MFPLNTHTNMKYEAGGRRNKGFRLRDNRDIICRNCVTWLNNRTVVLISHGSNYISKYISSPVTCMALCSANHCAKSHAVVCEKR